VIDSAKLRTALSGPFDELRNTLWAKTQAAIRIKGPLAVFRNQTDTIPLVRDVLVEHYGLTADPVVAIKQGQSGTGQQYPEALFEYLISKAPQIGNLA
jgi:hypothetical protein